MSAFQKRHTIAQAAIVAIFLVHVLLFTGCALWETPPQPPPVQRTEPNHTTSPGAAYKVDQHPQPQPAPELHTPQKQQQPVGRPQPASPAQPVGQKQPSPSNKPDVPKRPPVSDERAAAKPPVTPKQRLALKQPDTYSEQLKKLQAIRRDLEEKGYILDEANYPKVLKKDALENYQGFRVTFRAREKKYLPSFEKTVERELEQQFAHNFRRIYRGTMSNGREGIYVVDFIPQENLQTYQKNELRVQ